MRLTLTVISTWVILFMSCTESSQDLAAKYPLTLIGDSSSTVQISSNDTDSIHITYSYGAGNCIGYCETIFAIHSWGVVKTEKGWAMGGDATKYPKRVKILPIDSAEYKSLIQSLNSGFYFIPEVIGCPDCNDGGWEEILVSDADTSRSVLFPYGYSIPEIEPFLTNLKNITRK